MSRPYLIGLTGGLASGKSTVARWLDEAGCATIDADKLVAHSYRPGGAGAAAVEGLFGQEVLEADGAVDHEKLAERVFADPSARRRLELAIHPLVRAAFADLVRDCAVEVAVLEATLLVEAGFAPDFDFVVSVESSPETRLRRALERGWSEREARARLEAQGDGAARRAVAHYLLHNDGDLEALRAATDALLIEIHRRARARSEGANRLPFVFVTGNPGKRVEAERLTGARLETVEMDLPEIQSLDLAEILEHKAEEAWRRLRRPLVVEETGLYLAAWRGFPGPLVRWMLEAAGAQGIARSAIAVGEPRAAARCALLYRDGKRSISAEGETHGRLVLPPRGEQGFGWDPVFEPDGETRTYGELGAEEKDQIGHRGRAWRALLAQL